jgi:hypothetical protein
MKAQTEVPFVDTTIIPDRNAEIGSLLLDLRDSQYPVRDGSPLLKPDFAFIDVGASRAKVSTTLKTLLVRDLRMRVEYLATELPAAVPYAYVKPPLARSEEIRRYLSGMISTNETTREVIDWHYVVDVKGKVSSLAYSYSHVGNEVWESYFMGRPFMMLGEKIEFLDPTLNEMLAPDMLKIEARIALERELESTVVQPKPSKDGYKIEINPLETGLAEFGISLKKTDIPQRVRNKQNVLFLGNVLNHYPIDEQALELDRITANMQAGDIIIIKGDEMERSYVEVLYVNEQGAWKTRKRVRWNEKRIS